MLLPELFYKARLDVYISTRQMQNIATRIHPYAKTLVYKAVPNADRSQCGGTENCSFLFLPVLFAFLILRAFNC